MEPLEWSPQVFTQVIVTATGKVLKLGDCYLGMKKNTWPVWNAPFNKNKLPTGPIESYVQKKSSLL